MAAIKPERSDAVVGDLSAGTGQSRRVMQLPFWSRGLFDTAARKSLTRNGNPSLTPTQKGLSHSFSGADYYLHPTRGLAQSLGVFTWTVVFRTTATTTQSLVGVFNDGAKTGTQVRLNMNETGTTDAGNFGIFVRDEDGDLFSASLSTNPGVNDGNVHTVTFAHSGTSSDVKIWVDGADGGVVNFGPGTGGTVDNFKDFEYPLAIGARNVRGTIDNHFVGEILYFDWVSLRMTDGAIRAVHRDVFSPLRLAGDV